MSDATEKLDEDTEARIRDVIRFATFSPTSTIMILKHPDLTPEPTEIPALRQRIRELVEEARSSAVADFLADRNFKIEAVEK